MSAVERAVASAASRRRAALPTAALALAVVGLLCVVALGANGPLHGSAGPPVGVHAGGLPLNETPHPRRVFVNLPWLKDAGLAALAVAVAVLVLAAILALLMVRGRPRWAGGTSQVASAAGELDDRDAALRRAALRDAIVRSLEEIRNDPNARRAIIGAYRLMEVTLGRVGLARSPAEAPREYLARALGGLDVGADAPARLTALFERARFDDAELGLGLRDEAVGCLESLRASL